MMPRSKDVMLSCLLLSATLSLGQAGAPPTEPAAPVTPEASGPAPETAKLAASSSAVTPPDRWLLMKALQGTWIGGLLDSERVQVLGWIDMSYTASSDRRTNLPIGFNYQANEFLLQQNWIRFERTV